MVAQEVYVPVFEIAVEFWVPHYSRGLGRQLDAMRAHRGTTTTTTIAVVVAVLSIGGGGGIGRETFDAHDSCGQRGVYQIILHAVPTIEGK